MGSPSSSLSGGTGSGTYASAFTLPNRLDLPPSNMPTPGGGGGSGDAALLASTGFQIAGGGLAAYESHAGGVTSQRYYNYLSDTAKENAGLAEARGEAETKAIGAEGFSQQKALTRRINETQGAQKAAVSTGAGSSSRTAQDLLLDTIDKGNIDEMSLRLNTQMRTKAVQDQASIQAFNFRTQAAGYDVAGANAKRAGNLGVASSILGTGASVAQNWMRFPWSA